MADDIKNITSDSEGGAAPAEAASAGASRQEDGGPAIPAGWRRLDNSETLEAGDEFGYANDPKHPREVVKGLAGEIVAEFLSGTPDFYAIRRIPDAAGVPEPSPAEGSPSPSPEELIRELVGALEACKAELRYYPGDSNQEGDRAIDAAVAKADAALAKAKEKA